MRRFVVWFVVIMLMVSPTLMMTGCGNDAYVANMKHRTNKAMFEENAKARAMEAVTGAINAIIKAVEGEYQAEKSKEVRSKFVDKIGVNGNNFAVAVLGDIVVSMNRSHMEAEKMRARADAIRYLEPIVGKIYREQTDDNLGTPSTSFDVAMKFVDNLPFLATVWGMYGLGVKGIENAGNSIAGTFSDSAVNTGSGAAGSGNSRLNNNSEGASASGDTESTNQSRKNSNSESGSVSGDNPVIIPVTE